MEISAAEPGRAGPTTADRSAELLNGFRARLEGELAGWLAARRRSAAAALPEAAELVDAVAELATGGGKRLRPALVWFTFRACGGRDEGAVLPVALATELLHAYLLIHDDIMDHAEVRRGRPSVHARFRHRHAERGWPGAGEDFGRTAAILAGDLAHGWAVELFADGRRRAPADRAAELDRCFSAMCEEVIGGQYLEVVLGLRREASEEELLAVLRLKSGRYTVERPIQLGAVLAAAPAAARAALATYGRAVGEAFQLQDDVLGTFGDAETVGKPVGGDLAEGKYTFLIHHALRAAGAADAARLRGALGRADLPAGEVEAVRALLRSTGALDRVLAMVEERLAAARAALVGLDLASDGGDFLAGLVEQLWERRR
jgi:geranylgeranyl diphosphate synthase type I